MPNTRRSICFVTGTRAEFGLMVSTLRAIQSHAALRLQIIVTGMHLDARRGRTIDAIKAEGFSIDQWIPWGRESNQADLAAQTGRVMARLADAYSALKPDIVLVVGDRVEAFAAAAAAHISGRPVAHVHGGDRALGQVDDSLRHAITKLAHLHFPATAQSAERLRKLGEDPRRIHRAGSPGLDGIHAMAMTSTELLRQYDLKRHRFALLLLHPASPDEELESRRAGVILRALDNSSIPRIVALYPNNDPGATGIIGQLTSRRSEPRYTILPSAPRAVFLGLLRDAAFLIGNSSSGIIESASFRTPTLDIGPRQTGRERSANTRHISYAPRAVEDAIADVWRDGKPRRAPAGNVYGGSRTGAKIAHVLATTPLAPGLLRKLITY